MRVMKSMSSDERGAIAVITIFALIVFISFLGLVTDGGLLFLKYREVRRANDAAALAAAIECVRNPMSASAARTDAANGVATDYANRNGASMQWASNEYAPPPCVPSSGKVTVHYGGAQTLFLWPAIHALLYGSQGDTSSKVAAASSTATWGSAGGAANVAPLMLTSGALNSCSIPTGTPPQTCRVWWDSDLFNQSTYGVMNLKTWGWSANQPGCGPDGANLPSTVDKGWPTPLSLDTVPTYVCALSGVKPVTTQINHNLPETFMFPVNDPSKQVDAGGNPCPSSSTICTLDKFAIVGFAQLQISTPITTGKAAADACGVVLPKKDSPGNFHCMQATWLNWSTSGIDPGGGQNFGVTAVALTG